MIFYRERMRGLRLHVCIDQAAASKISRRKWDLNNRVHLSLARPGAIEAFSDVYTPLIAPRRAITRSDTRAFPHDQVGAIDTCQARFLRRSVSRFDRRRRRGARARRRDLKSFATLSRTTNGGSTSEREREIADAVATRRGSAREIKLPRKQWGHNDDTVT